jgi:hypothetical protein
MLLFWVAYTFLYATALWSHLDAPGALHINSVTARLGRPAMEVSHFLLSAGLPLANIPAAPTNLTPILTEVPIPVSTRISVPDTIIFPASPLPTAHLRHKALPLCYNGLNDDSTSATEPATRTATGTSTDLTVNGPGLITRYFLVTLTLATALTTRLVYSSACPAVICILGLVCLSRVLFVMRRTAFQSAAARIQVNIRTLLLFHKITLTLLFKVSSHCPCSCGRDLNAREVANSGDLLVTADTSFSPSPPSPPSPSPLPLPPQGACDHASGSHKN